MNILIIDDEKFLVENLARYLRQKIATEINCVNGSEEAMKLIDKEKYDCIICDLNLSDQSDGELILNIIEKVPNQKFIVISAQEIPRQILRENKTNIAAYFEKPFDMEEIKKSIQSIKEEAQ